MLSETGYGLFRTPVNHYAGTDCTIYQYCKRIAKLESTYLLVEETKDMEKLWNWAKQKPKSEKSRAELNLETEDRRQGKSS